MVFEYKSARAKLADESLNKADRLKSLVEASQALGRIESLDELLPQLLRLAQDVTCAEASSILLYRPEKNVLEFTLALNEIIGEDGAGVLKEKIELPLGVGIAGWVAQKKKPLNVTDAQNDARFNKNADLATGFVTRCLVCIPIMNRSQLLGVVQVLNSKIKPAFDEMDVEILESFGQLAGVALVRSQLLDDKLKQEKFRSQLEAASRIQEHFWPKLPVLKGGVHIWGRSSPSTFVGGDLYDFIPMADGSWIVYLADVSGKGLPAALIMAALWSRIRSLVNAHENPGELLEAVNNAVEPIMACEMFATILLGRVWPKNGRLRLALGGHLPPVWIGKNGQKTPPNLRGFPLGIMPGAKYESSEIRLSPGDSILFMTDGVTEARSKKGEFFNEERVIGSLEKSKVPPMGKTLFSDVSAWRKGTQPNDDTTVVEIWREEQGIHTVQFLENIVYPL